MIKTNQDFPKIVINSIPAPELVFDKIEDNDLSLYIKGLEELDKMDLDFIIMVCNTIYLFYEKLQSKIKTEIIDLRKEVYKELKKEGRRITIIGTPGTIKKGPYNFEDIEYINPNEEEIKILSEVVFNFNRGFRLEEQKNKTMDIINKYLSQGSEIILLGCTEFAVMLEDEDIPKKNTIDILVNVVVNRCLTKHPQPLL